MLTDIFSRRYEQPRMWETFSEEPRRLLAQGYQLLNDICPYYVRMCKASYFGRKYTTCWRESLA